MVEKGTLYGYYTIEKNTGLLHVIKHPSDFSTKIQYPIITQVLQLLSVSNIFQEEQKLY